MSNSNDPHHHITSTYKDSEAVYMPVSDDSLGRSAYVGMLTKDDITVELTPYIVDDSDEESKNIKNLQDYVTFVETYAHKYLEPAYQTLTQALNARV